MPYRRIPNTGTSVVRCLQTAHDKAKITPVDQRAITPEQWAQLDLANPASLFSRVLKEVSEADLAQAAQKPLVNQESIIAARLTMFVSHFHQALDNGISRGTFAAGSRSYYKRDVDATGIPDLSSYGAVKTAARHIVKGEAERALAETNGWTRFDTGQSFDRGASFDGTPPEVKAHVPMSNPSAAEVSGLLALFEEVSNRLSTAKTRTNKEQEDWDALYPLAQELAVDINDTVEFKYRKDPEAGSRRAKCEEYGVTYIYDNQPEPTPPAIPTPTTQPATPTTLNP